MREAGLRVRARNASAVGQSAGGVWPAGLVQFYIARGGCAEQMGAVGACEWGGGEWEKKAERRGEDDGR